MTISMSIGWLAVEIDHISAQDQRKMSLQEALKAAAKRREMEAEEQGGSPRARLLNTAWKPPRMSRYSDATIALACIGATQNTSGKGSEICLVDTSCAPKHLATCCCLIMIPNDEHVV